MGKMRAGFHLAGAFDTSSLASMNRASSSALLTVSTSSFARINLQTRCSVYAAPASCPCWSCTRTPHQSCEACRHPWSAVGGLRFWERYSGRNNMVGEIIRLLSFCLSNQIGFAAPAGRRPPCVISVSGLPGPAYGRLSFASPPRRPPVKSSTRSRVSYLPAEADHCDRGPPKFRGPVQDVFSASAPE
jgi:hypothetical protein